MKSLRLKFRGSLKRIGANLMFKLIFATGLMAQSPTVGILDFETNGLIQNSRAISDLVRIEMEKTKKYQVLDFYDLQNALALKEVKLENCKSPNCLLDLGKTVNADYMMSGSTKRFGEKIIVTLRLHNVQTKETEKTSVMEYLNLQPEIQRMIRLSIEDLAGIESDKQTRDLLTFYDH